MKTFEPRARIPLFAVALALLPFAGSALAQKMYFTDYGARTIMRANLDGSTPEVLVSTSLSLPLGLALDIAGGKMYWSDASLQKIERSNLDGSTRETLVTGIVNIDAMALDVAAGKMYWTEEAGNVRRANLDGSTIELLISGLPLPIGIDLDVAGGKIYFADLTDHWVRRSNLDGTVVQTLVNPPGSGDLAGIDLDVAGNRMFFTDQGGRVHRANLDGSGLMTPIPSGLTSPSDIALDVAAGKMYFTNQDGRVMRSNLDGTSQELLYTGTRCFGIDLDLGPPPPPPPTCTLVLISPSPASDDIDLELDASSASAPTLDAAFEHSTDAGATWTPSSPAAVSSNPLVGLPSGSTTPFVWDSRADGVGTSIIATGVLVRATVTDGSAAPGICTSAAFDVDNTALCPAGCGDCNRDALGPGIIDALVAAQVAAAIIAPTPAQTACCDVNANLTVEILDALVIAQAAAGLPVTLTCP